MGEDEGVRLADRPIPVVPHPSEADSRAIGKEAAGHGAPGQPRHLRAVGGPA